MVVLKGGLGVNFIVMKHSEQEGQEYDLDLIIIIIIMEIIVDENYKKGQCLYICFTPPKFRQRLVVKRGYPRCLKFNTNTNKQYLPNIKH